MLQAEKYKRKPCLDEPEGENHAKSSIKIPFDDSFLKGESTVQQGVKKDEQENIHGDEKVAWPAIVKIRRVSRISQGVTKEERSVDKDYKPANNRIFKLSRQFVCSNCPSSCNQQEYIDEDNISHHLPALGEDG
jgi:hypothetical protein